MHIYSRYLSIYKHAHVTGNSNKKIQLINIRTERYIDWVMFISNINCTAFENIYMREWARADLPIHSLLYSDANTIMYSLPPPVYMIYVNISHKMRAHSDTKMCTYYYFIYVTFCTPNDAHIVGQFYVELYVLYDGTLVCSHCTIVVSWCYFCTFIL